MSTPHISPPDFGAPGPLTARLIYAGMTDAFALARRAGRSVEEARLEAEEAGRRLAALAIPQAAARQIGSEQDANLHLETPPAAHAEALP